MTGRDERFIEPGEVEVHDQATREDDAETIEVAPVEIGPPVDPPDERPGTFATLAAYSASTDDRPPLVPSWLRSRRDFATVLRWKLGCWAYLVALHTRNSPLYLVKLALWAPAGAGRLLWRWWRWTYDLEQGPERRRAADRDDVDAYIKLAREADLHRSARLKVFFLLLVLGTVAGALWWWLAPTWVHVATLAVVVPVLAIAGRPADRPILARVEVGPKYVKLTAELVRNALCTLGIASMREPSSVTFPQMIHRDGPGQLARVNLPAGVDAVEVMSRKGRLCSALRLPADQVWPSAGPDHTGQMDLWVGFLPASKMRQPRWELAAGNARTSVFDPVPFGVDQRQRPVSTPLIERNFLIGGQPGSGKSYGARALALAAALDPHVELKIIELKGTGDFADLAPLCSTYVCGVDDASLEDGARVFAWGLAEAERRGERIRRARERGEAPVGKVTPQLAARRRSGLHPVVIIVDEAHELLVDKAVANAAERLIKRGRALGIIVILATQIPDRQSVPPAITRCVSTRWCMSVQDHVPNDQILGTGSYKAGLTATGFRPGIDAGWGVVTGIETPGNVRSYFPDAETAAAIVARATELRGGVVTGPAGDDPTPDRDPVADVWRCWDAFIDRPAIAWGDLATVLAEQLPERYAEITADEVSAMLRAAGVPSQDVKVRGRALKGCRREAVEAVARQREVGRGRGTATTENGPDSGSEPALTAGRDPRP